MDKPVVRKRRSLSPIWILPLLALGIGCWLLYTTYRDAGINVTIHFPDAIGITPGKTKVIFKGIPVGTVKEVEVDDQLTGVSLEVEMAKETRDGLVEDTKFWVVKPEISAGRISGLDTLLSGSYIAVRPGESNEHANHFQGLASQPPSLPDAPGLHIILESDTLYSLQRGSNIYSKNLQIGRVEDYRLDDDGKIRLEAVIQPEFSHLIRTGTRFWNASGLSISGDLQRGVTVNVESMASLIYGGITCATPSALATSEPAPQSTTFTLYRDFEAAEYGIEATLQAADSTAMVAGKTRVLFRGIKIGFVKSLQINDDPAHTVTATLLLDPSAEPILRKGTRFFILRPEVGLTGVKNLEAILTGPYISVEPGEGPVQNHFLADSGTMPRQTLRTGTLYTLVAEDNGSLDIGAPVLFKRMPVGEIVDIAFDSQNSQVRIAILVYQPHDQLVRPDSVFYNVSGLKIDGSLSEFNVSLDSLQTALAGGVAFVNPRPASAKTAQAAASSSFPLFQSFRQAENAVPALLPPGLRIVLEADKMPPLQTGAQVYYNNIPVGKVLDFQLASNRENVEVSLLVFDQYADLVRTTSHFYNFSGLELKASLHGVVFETAPLSAIISGGVAFFTGHGGKAVKNGYRFKLHPDFAMASNADAVGLKLVLPETAGLEAQAKIKYRGFVVGQILSLDLDYAQDRIVATAYITRESAGLFRTGSILWVVRPTIALTGIDHAETVFTGNYIEVRPGPGEAQREFQVQSVPPEPTGRPGLNIVLETQSRGSVKIGSPVYYRQVPVGEVSGFALSPSAQQVWIDVNILPEYVDLVRSNTKFWKASGLSVTGGVLSGLELRTESMQAFLAGGLALATPDATEVGMPARNGDHFPLSATPEPGWEEWRPVLTGNKAGQAAPGERQAALSSRKSEQEAH